MKYKNKKNEIEKYQYIISTMSITMSSTSQYRDLNEFLAKHSAKEEHNKDVKYTHSRIPGGELHRRSGSYIIPKEECVKTLYTKNDISDVGITGIYTSHCNTLGGIIKFTPEFFIKTNGFPNNYWGWGVEDKALQNRAEYMYHNITINKNILNNDENRFNYFTIKNDIDDRQHDNLGHKTSFEYGEFNNLSDENKLIHIMKSGLNNLDYKIISREYIKNDEHNENIENIENIERIKVCI